MPSEQSSRLENELNRLSLLCQKGPISIGNLVEETAPHDQALLTLILSLPFLLPMPLPGLSIPFGISIFLISLRMIQGKPIWLPNFLKRKTLSTSQAQALFSKLKPVAHKLARMVRPRGSFFLRRSSTKLVAFFCIAIAGLLLALPLPPGTNAPPALTCVLLSLGVLEHDGIYLLLGFLCFLAISILFVTFIWWGYPQIIQWFGY